MLLRDTSTSLKLQVHNATDHFTSNDTAYAAAACITIMQIGVVCVAVSARSLMSQYSSRSTNATLLAARDCLSMLYLSHFIADLVSAS
jgi:hypothetical protein